MPSEQVQREGLLAKDNKALDTSLMRLKEAEEAKLNEGNRGFADDSDFGNGDSYDDEYDDESEDEDGDYQEEG